MKKALEILAIILPALIIVLGLMRLFVKNAKGVNTLTIFIAFLLLGIGTVHYFFYFGNGVSISSDNKEKPLTVSKHSEIFNSSVENVLNAYYKMTEGFVNWDTSTIQNSGGELKIALDSLKLDEIKEDTLIYETVQQPYQDAKTELSSILADPSIAEKRGSLNILSDNLRNLLVILKYDRDKIYWQECPMAFGDDKPGNWLSKSTEVRNPYLGTKDPQYGDKMLNCGGPKDTIKFE